MFPRLEGRVVLLAGALLLAPMSGPGRATTDCIDYSGYLRCLASVDLPDGGPIGFSERHALVGGHVLEVSDRLHPRLMCSGSSGAQDIAVSGRFAYVASSSGFRVIDLENGTDAVCPSIVAAIDLEATAVDVVGNYAFVGTSAYGHPGAVWVIDITDPRSPWIAGHLELPDGVYCLGISGDRAYVGAGRWVHVVDITDPAHPALMASMFFGYPALDLAVVDHCVFAVGTAGRLEVIDLSDPTTPRWLYHLFLSNHHGTSITISGHHAFIANAGLFVVDILDARNPRIVGVDESTEASELALCGDVVYVVTAWGRLRIFDAANPEGPPVVGALETPDEGTGLAVSGGHAYFAGLSALRVIDISSPADPRIVASVAPAHGYRCVTLSESSVFALRLGTTGVWMDLDVIDVSDPDSPEIRGALQTGATNGPCGLAAASPYVYVANGGNPEFQVIDASDPANPVPVGGTPLAGGGRGVTVSGTLACVVGEKGLHVVDMSVPEDPRVLSVVGAGPCYGVAVAGARAYVGTASQLLIVDISDPSSPGVLGGLSLPRGGGPVAVSGSIAYVGSTVVQVVDVADAASPRLLGTVYVARGSAIAPSGSGLCTAGLGFGILPFQCGSESIRTGTPDGHARAGRPDVRVLPNPASRRATIRIDLTGGGPVSTTLYDVMGREVRRVSEGFLPAGIHEVAWDGRDHAGREVASGIYMVRVSGRGGTSTARVVLVR